MAAAGTGRGEPGECGGPLAPHQVQLRAWLRPADGSRGLRLTKVHDLLAHQGVGVPYSSLHRYVVEHCGFQDVRRPTVRVANVASGELAEVDFGRLGLVSDPATGRRRLVHALIVTLVRSRHQYVHVTTSQKLADLIAGLEDAWEFFGGVVRRVVLESSLETIRRMINRQRDACVLQLQRIVKRKGEPVRAAGSASSFMRALLIEAAEFHLQAELKWLSHRARRRRGVGQAAASKPLRPPVEGGGQDRTAPSLRLTARFLPEPLLSHLRSYLRLTCFQLHRVPWRREYVHCGSNQYL